VIMSPVSDIGPCDDQFGGRIITDFCRDCHHALGVHRQDHVCSVCEAVAGINIAIGALYQEVQKLKGIDPDATR
jgi:hypothetical protein